MRYTNFKKLFMVLIFSLYSIASWATTTTGIAGVDENVSLGQKIIQVFCFILGIGCITYVAYMFGTGKAKGQSLELLWGILVMGALIVGGTAWWMTKSSGFIF
ncbi:MAG: hypothetical protein ACK5Z5_01350 [Neisseriaceae bacterium]|jgi:hypothetical protein